MRPVSGAVHDLLLGNRFLVLFVSVYDTDGARL
jgi:hypothetical protein